MRKAYNMPTHACGDSVLASDRRDYTSALAPIFWPKAELGSFSDLDLSPPLLESFLVARVRLYKGLANPNQHYTIIIP